jgi:predicted phosphoadenosine phosphosulfate sulfurtransferase
MKKYTQKNVLESAKERICLLFDEFENISVSVSGGKDSTVIWHLALQEAIKRNRRIEVIFLDQEAEYFATIDVVRYQMAHENVLPSWYQMELSMVNATSNYDAKFIAWQQGKNWIRPKEKTSIKEMENAPKRFYQFFDFIQEKQKNTANIIGLRADESLLRFRAMSKNNGYKGLNWCTAVSKKNNTYKFYPIYDWKVSDIWRYIYDNNVFYNSIYDKMFQANYNPKDMRVSFLLHDIAFKCLADLPKFEPNTYELLRKRVQGVSNGHLYARSINNEDIVLPDNFLKWSDFLEFLLKNLKNEYIQQNYDTSNIDAGLDYIKSIHFMDEFNCERAVKLMLRRKYSFIGQIENSDKKSKFLDNF